MNRSGIFFILLFNLINLLPIGHAAPVLLAQSGESGTISGTAWFDTNRNGIQEPSEAVASQVTIEIRTAAGSLTQTAVTNDGGAYVVVGLSFGIYHVSGVEYDGTMTTEQTVELNEITGAVNVDLPMKEQSQKVLFFPLIHL